MALLSDCGSASAAGALAAQEVNARLLARCRKLAGGLPALAPRALQRDFYPDQVIVGPGGLALVDLDLFAEGDAALDAGNFVAHLSEWALRERGDDWQQTIHIRAADINGEIIGIRIYEFDALGRF